MAIPVAELSKTRVLRFFGDRSKKEMTGEIRLLLRGGIDA